MTKFIFLAALLLASPALAIEPCNRSLTKLWLADPENRGDYNLPFVDPTSVTFTKDGATLREGDKTTMLEDTTGAGTGISIEGLRDPAAPDDSDEGIHSYRFLDLSAVAPGREAMLFDGDLFWPICDRGEASP